MAERARQRLGPPDYGGAWPTTARRCLRTSFAPTPPTDGAARAPPTIPPAALRARAMANRGMWRSGWWLGPVPDRPRRWRRGPLVEVLGLPRRGGVIPWPRAEHVILPEVPVPGRPDARRRTARATPRRTGSRPCRAARCRVVPLDQVTIPRPRCAAEPTASWRRDDRGCHVLSTSDRRVAGHVAATAPARAARETSLTRRAPKSSPSSRTGTRNALPDAPTRPPHRRTARRDPRPRSSGPRRERLHCAPAARAARRGPSGRPSCAACSVVALEDGASLRAKASGWPAYPNSPPRKPPWWLGNTVAADQQLGGGHRRASGERALVLLATAITMRVGAAASA